MKTSYTPTIAARLINMPSWYFTGAYDFHQSSDTDREGGSRFELAAQTDEQACGKGSTHLLNQSGPRRGGGAKPITWNSSVDTLMLILSLKVFMNETPLFKTRPPPSQRRTTWRKEWCKAERLRGLSKLARCSISLQRRVGAREACVSQWMWSVFSSF